MFLHVLLLVLGLLLVVLLIPLLLVKSPLPDKSLSQTIIWVASEYTMNSN
jgi:hypothetical protein